MKLSVVVPAYNESESLSNFYHSLSKILSKLKLEDYEIVFVDDGSLDDTAKIILAYAKKDKSIRLICFSRNFGKEAATTAGLREASGDAAIIIDSDGQHPVELIPEFVSQWQKGYKVITGVRKANKKEGYVKRIGSKAFYKLFNALSDFELVPRSTDFRLIDRIVIDEFNKLQERNRITRGLIDWLGFKRSYIEFQAKERLAGRAAYNFKKLVNLALNSFISLSFTPLYLSGYLGLIIVALSSGGGIFVFVEQFLLNDPLQLRVTAGALLGLLILFTTGIVLVSQTILTAYISRIYTESQARPLYIIDKTKTHNASLV